MPEHFTIDVSGLELGQTLHIRDLQKIAPEGILILGDADASVVSVSAPRKEAEAAAEGAAQA